MRLKPTQDMRDIPITIHKSRGVDRWVLFFLTLTVFAPAVGVLVLWSATVAESWWILLLTIIGGVFLIGTGPLFLQWGVTILGPARVVIGEETVRHFVGDSLHQVVELDETASLTPSFNYFMG